MYDMRVDPYIRHNDGEVGWRVICKLDFPIVTKADGKTIHRIVAYGPSTAEAIQKITNSGAYNQYISEFHDTTSIGTPEVGEFHYLVDPLNPLIDPERIGNNTLLVL